MADIPGLDPNIHQDYAIDGRTYRTKAMGGPAGMDFEESVSVYGPETHEGVPGLFYVGFVDHDRPHRWITRDHVNGERGKVFRTRMQAVHHIAKHHQPS